MQSIYIAISMILLSFSPKTEPPPAAHGITQISIYKGPCFGYCPVYDASFFSDGNATFEGKEPRRSTIPPDYPLGKNIGNISKEKFDSLAALVEKVKFFEMSDHIEQVTDLPSTKITVVRNDTTKSVKIYGLRPSEEMKKLMSTLEQVAKETKWKPMPDKSE